MARRLRNFPPGYAQHVIQRGNNRQICFASDEDFAAYAHWLQEQSERFGVAIHSWVFMTNHVHLLCTPSGPESLPKMMQSLGRLYVRYFNHKYRRTGTLWEGRYKACLVDTDEYLLHLYRYIELNPVRAEMVADPGDYRWSSYQCNGLGKAVSLCTPHEKYLSLGQSDGFRQKVYRSLFRYQVDGELLEDIRKSANKGLVLGSERFVTQMEELTGACLRERRRGRPVEV